MTADKLLEEVQEKYSEWLEMEGENSPLLMNRILAKMILQERENKIYYKRRLLALEKGTG